MTPKHDIPSDSEHQLPGRKGVAWRGSQRWAAAAAILLSASLAVTACGKDDDDDASAASPSTATSTLAKPTTTQTEEKPAESEEAQPEGEQAEGEQPKDEKPEADQQAGGEQADPLNPTGGTGVEPIEGGQPASAEDAEAITGLVMGLNDQQTVRSFVAYMPEHMCSEVLEANGGADALDVSGIPDNPIDQSPNYDPNNPPVAGVSDILVNGDRASATVTANTSEGQQTDTMRFYRENGTWTFCS